MRLPRAPIRKDAEHDRLSARWLAWICEVVLKHLSCHLGKRQHTSCDATDFGPRSPRPITQRTWDMVEVFARQHSSFPCLFCASSSTPTSDRAVLKPQPMMLLSQSSCRVAVPTSAARRYRVACRRDRCECIHILNKPNDWLSHTSARQSGCMLEAPSRLRGLVCNPNALMHISGKWRLLRQTQSNATELAADDKILRHGARNAPICGLVDQRKSSGSSVRSRKGGGKLILSTCIGN